MEGALIDFEDEEEGVRVCSPKLLRGVPRDNWTKGKKVMESDEPKYSQAAIQIPSF